MHGPESSAALLASDDFRKRRAQHQPRPRTPQPADPADLDILSHPPGPSAFTRSSAACLHARTVRSPSVAVVPVQHFFFCLIVTRMRHIMARLCTALSAPPVQHCGGWTDPFVGRIIYILSAAEESHKACCHRFAYGSRRGSYIVPFTTYLSSPAGRATLVTTANNTTRCVSTSYHETRRCGKPNTPPLGIRAASSQGCVSGAGAGDGQSSLSALQTDRGRRGACTSF